MDQYSYETILACINKGAPAIAGKLIDAFNYVMNLANERTQQIQAEQAIAAQKATASTKKASKKS